MSETRDARLRRLRMRSWRRGIKEMDLILEAFARRSLELMDQEELQLYDDLICENDQDLYRWVTQQEPAPERFAALVTQIAAQYQE